MNSVQIANRTRRELLIALGVFLSCLALIAIDKDTHTWNDLFYPGNIVALLIYFTPTYVLSCLLYRVLSRRNAASKSIWFSLVIGVPTGFGLIILFFVLVSG